ncbi:MAG TPA: NfeD family protein [Mycobacteriales bacterium]|nr:NfeD family protein [Mycobacteriales bacterium]
METPRRASGSRRLLATLLAVTGLLALLGGQRVADAQQDRTRIVDIVEISGRIDSSYADYVIDQLELAAREKHAAVVLRIIGSGSVKVDDLRLVKAIRDADVPVATWVGPVILGKTEAVAGAHTAMWFAGDVRFVAHGARIRSVFPLQPGGRTDVLTEEETRFPRVFGIYTVQELPLYIRAPFREVTERDALKAEWATFVKRTGADPDGRIVDGTVNSIDDVIRALDGQVVRLPSGTRTLDFSDSQAFDTRIANPGLITKVRRSLGTTPWLVYLLLLIGAGAIVFELFQSGFGPAGYTGAVLVALAAYGLTALPISPLGLTLLLGGIAMLSLDVARGGFGLLTWGGTAALTAGSFVFVDGYEPGLRVGWPVIALGVIGSWIFYVVVMTVVLRALRGQSAATGEGLIGQEGEVRSTLNPQGHVLVDGALWRARAVEWDGPLDAGTRVTVTGVDSEALILDVVPI